MSEFVIDASAALSWCFADEATPATRALLERLEQDTALAPSIWPIEVANVLAMAERRQRITQAGSTAFTALLMALPITVDDETPGRAFAAVLDLARHERLSAYDACYLELAMRRSSALATRDRVLAAAASRVGVAVIALG